VVKANGYGLGAVPVARAALEAGAWGLAVATSSEAAEVVELVEDPERVLVMGGLNTGAAELGCALQVSSAAQVQELAATGRRVPVHLKVDTGMGRFGCRPEEAPALAQAIVEAGLRLAGTWTHFSSADSDDALTRRQFDLFEDVLSSLGVDPGLRHACNSAAALRHPEFALDAVRTGIAIYGCDWPELRPALSLRALLTNVMTVPAGWTVGYGATWRAEREARIGTVAIGYADGVFRARGNAGWVLARGRRAPLIGRVSMDAISVDLSDVDDAAVGDTVTLIGSDGGERISAEQVAEWSGTISYEVLTALGPRVERRYSE